MIWIVAFVISALCALVLWSACAVGAKADRSAWRNDLAAQWPAMPELEGIDLFLEECGPPVGEKEQS